MRHVNEGPVEKRGIGADHPASQHAIDSFVEQRSQQGEHSRAWIADPGFRSAVADFLERERAGIADDQFYLGSRTPFRKGE